MKKVLLTGLAGAIGAISRSLITLFVTVESGFPFATLMINLVGTFLLCFLVAGMIHKVFSAKDIQDAVTTGFLGSFTTFSAFSMETILLFEAGHIIMGAFYIGLSIVGGITAGLLGFHYGRKKVRI